MCAAIVLAFNIVGLRSMLIRPGQVVWEVLARLWGGFAITFGSLVCGNAGIDGGDDPGG
jgi:hypothetical protein